MACISLPTAMLVGGAVSGIGSIASAIIGSNAAQQAAKQQTQAIQTAATSSTDIFNQQKNLLAPFITAGSNVGVTGMEGLLTGGQAAQTLLESTPGYKFALNQGLMSTQNAYAAQGLGSSGAALRGAADYATGLANETYQSIFGNFNTLAQLGENAGGALSGAASSYSENLASLLAGIGTAGASGTVGSANALTSGLTGLTGALGNSALMLGLNNSGFFNTPASAASGGNALIPSNYSATRGFY